MPRPQVEFFGDLKILKELLFNIENFNVGGSFERAPHTVGNRDSAIRVCVSEEPREYNRLTTHAVAVIDCRHNDPNDLLSVPEKMKISTVKLNRIGYEQRIFCLFFEKEEDMESFKFSRDPNNATIIGVCSTNTESLNTLFKNILNQSPDQSPENKNDNDNDNDNDNPSGFHSPGLR